VSRLPSHRRHHVGGFELVVMDVVDQRSHARCHTKSTHRRSSGIHTKKARNGLLRTASVNDRAITSPVSRASVSILTAHAALAREANVSNAYAVLSYRPAL